MLLKLYNLDIFLYLHIMSNIRNQGCTLDCKNARQNYRKAKRLNKKFGGYIFKSDLYEKEKFIKKKKVKKKQM